MSISPLTALQHALAQGDTTARAVAEDVIAHANQNAGRNSYIHFDPEAVVAQAASLDARAPLYSIPVSLKDLFDQAGTVTTSGTRFYADRNAPATEDSAVAARLKERGCLITGKTHLHPIAYGITGENPDFGDCLQPRDGTLLTGGSSSGAVASVQEGSALAAIGTDTGGSVRVPAGLGGLTGYRASRSLASAEGGWPDLWRGGAHLAQSFDTLGLIFRDPRDAAPLAHELFDIPPGSAPVKARIGCVPLSYLSTAEPAVLSAYAAWKTIFVTHEATLTELDVRAWAPAVELLTHIQAHEAAALHPGAFDEFGPAIAQRLHFGASITEAAMAGYRERHREFVAKLVAMFEDFDFFILPSAPVSRLFAGADHSGTRLAILPYTAPFSLAGVPVVTLPGEAIGTSFGTGLQVAAAPGNDAALLAWVAQFGGLDAERGNL